VHGYTRGALFYPSPFFTPFLLNLTLSSLA
jgi:hypothetical protein